jgi:hypothetical protein
VYALTKEEGGRHTPFTNNYRPQFFFRTADITGEGGGAGPGAEFGASWTRLGPACLGPQVAGAAVRPTPNGEPARHSQHLPPSFPSAPPPPQAS